MSIQRWNTTSALVSWERHDEGEWVRYEDHIEELARVIVEGQSSES